MGTTEVELSPGALVDRRYQIQHVLGRGGFGRTYLAIDQCRFGEFCVLKEFAPTSQSDPIVTQKLQDLFQREANILHQLNHQQIPQFFSVFQAEGRSFIAQEYINGKTYWSLLRDRHYQGESFSELEIVQWLWDLLQVLDYLHQRNIIHRDISPDNIMQAQGRPLPILIDFGAVKQAAHWLQANQTTDWMQASVSVGKSGYAPIEQLQMGQCSPASDLYALAVTAVVLLTCKTPNQLINPTSLEWHWQSLVDLQPALIAILETMMAEKPQARYASAPAVLAALRSIYPTLETQRLIPAIALYPESATTDWLAIQSVPPLWNHVATPATPVAPSANSIASAPLNSSPLNSSPLNSSPANSAPLNSSTLNSSTVNSSTLNSSTLNSSTVNPAALNPAAFNPAAFNPSPVSLPAPLSGSTHFNATSLGLSAIATANSVNSVQPLAQPLAQSLVQPLVQPLAPDFAQPLAPVTAANSAQQTPQDLGEPAIDSSAKSFSTVAAQLPLTELKHLIQQLLPPSRFKSAVLLSLVTLLPLSGLALGIASPRIALLCQPLNNCTSDLKAEADFRTVLGQANAAQMSADQARRIADLIAARDRLLIAVNELTALASKVTNIAMADKLVTQYKNSLEAIEARLDSEFQAQDLLDQSTAAASLALDQTRAAQTPQDYLLAQLSWNRALALLQSISSQSWLAEQARWRSQDYAIRIDAINLKLGKKPQFFPELATSGNPPDLLLAQALAQSFAPPHTAALTTPSTVENNPQNNPQNGADNSAQNSAPQILQPSHLTTTTASPSRFAATRRSPSIDTRRYPYLAAPAATTAPTHLNTWADNLRRNYMSTSSTSIATLPASPASPAITAITSIPVPPPQQSPAHSNTASRQSPSPITSPAAATVIADARMANPQTAPVDRRRSAFPNPTTSNRSATPRSQPTSSTAARAATPTPSIAAPATPAASFPIATATPATATAKSSYSQSARNIILDAAQTLDDVSISLSSARLSHGTLVANLVIENRSDRTFGFVPLFAEIQDSTGRTLQSRIMLDNADSAMIAPGNHLQAQVYLFDHDWSGSGSQNVALIIKEGTTGQRNFRLAF